ncbi:MAG: dTDP-glucose 4,6-dehydratase [Pseudomonadota bacterium]
MNILVTGGCGFIGSALCRYLVANTSNQVVNLDALTYAAEPRSLSSIEQQPNYLFVQGDINDTELVLRLLNETRIDSIAHLAAESHVDRSIDGPEIFLKTNVMGTYSLLQAVRRYISDNPERSETFRFLHVSTDEVYGDLREDDPAFTETTAYKPSSPYSASKAASDHLVSAWGRTFQVPILITNCSNNYGPYQFPEKLIPLMIITALSNGQLPVYGDGRNIRDWLHVEDHAKGLDLVLNQGKPGETYNIGGKSERRNIEIVNMICQTLDELTPRADGKSYSEQITFVKDRPGHDHRYAVSCNKIEQELGWQPEQSFESGLQATIEWYLDNRPWWEPLMKRNMT